MSTNPNITGLRNEIDNIDERIILLLLERIRLVQAIGVEKLRLGEVIVDSKREREIFARIDRFCRPSSTDLLPAIIEIYRTILQQSREIQVQDHRVD